MDTDTTYVTMGGAISAAARAVDAAASSPTPVHVRIVRVMAGPARRRYQALPMTEPHRDDRRTVMLCTFTPVGT